ncbi:hypothetical protein [Nostoc sp.]
MTCWTDKDLIHINITGLFNSVCDRTGNGICINSDRLSIYTCFLE